MSMYIVSDRIDVILDMRARWRAGSESIGRHADSETSGPERRRL